MKTIACNIFVLCVGNTKSTMYYSNFMKGWIFSKELNSSQKMTRKSNLCANKPFQIEIYLPGKGFVIRGCLMKRSFSLIWKVVKVHYEFSRKCSLKIQNFQSLILASYSTLREKWTWVKTFLWIPIDVILEHFNFVKIMLQITTLFIQGYFIFMWVFF